MFFIRNKEKREDAVFASVMPSLTDFLLLVCLQLNDTAFVHYLYFFLNPFPT